MAVVLNAHKIVHPNEIVARLTAGVYAGKDGMAQIGLSEKETAWLNERLTAEAVLRQVSEETERKASWRTLYGRDNDVLSILFILIVIVFFAFLFRLLQKMIVNRWK